MGEQNMGGLSSRNLNTMRSLAAAWPDAAIVQELAAQLPWGHNCILIARFDDPKTLIVAELPEELRSSLPSVEEIEKELGI
jgi:hypothetical protein